MIPVEFFNEIWGENFAPLLGEIRAFKQGEGPRQAFVPSPEAAVDEALFHKDEGRDVYFGVLLRAEAKGTAESASGPTRIMWADFDAKAFGGRLMGPRSAFSELANMRLTPHIIVDSGHGYHAYWRLNGAYAFDDVQTVMKGIERQHGSDHCSDAARILRVPGTINHKNGEDLPVRIVRFDTFSAPYSLDSFQDYYHHAPTPRSTSAFAGGESWEPSDEDAPKFPEGERNHGLTRVAGAMVHKGMSPEEILVALSWENEQRCMPPLMAHEVAAIAKSVERYRS